MLFRSKQRLEFSKHTIMTNITEESQSEAESDSSVTSSLEMAEEHPKHLQEFSKPSLTDIQSSIVRPAIVVSTFKIKAGSRI